MSASPTLTSIDSRGREGAIDPRGRSGTRARGGDGTGSGVRPRTTCGPTPFTRKEAVVETPQQPDDEPEVTDAELTFALEAMGYDAETVLGSGSREDRDDDEASS